MTTKTNAPEKTTNEVATPPSVIEELSKAGFPKVWEKEIKSLGNEFRKKERAYDSIKWSLCSKILEQKGKALQVPAKVYKRAAELTGISGATLKTYVSCANNIKLPRRNANVSFTHHMEVASITNPNSQKALLNRVEKNNLTVEALRKLVTPVKAKQTEAKAKAKAKAEGTEYEAPKETDSLVEKVNDDLNIINKSASEFTAQLDTMIAGKNKANAEGFDTKTYSKAAFNLLRKRLDEFENVFTMETVQNPTNAEIKGETIMVPETANA